MHAGGEPGHVEAQCVERHDRGEGDRGGGEGGQRELGAAYRRAGAHDSPRRPSASLRSGSSSSTRRANCISASSPKSSTRRDTSASTRRPRYCSRGITGLYTSLFSRRRRSTMPRASRRCMIVSTVVYARGASGRPAFSPSSTSRTVASPRSHTCSIARRSRSGRCGAAMGAQPTPTSRSSWTDLRRFVVQVHYRNRFRHAIISLVSTHQTEFSAAVEDYSKAIFSLQGELDGPVSTTALAERLCVTPASASGMVKKHGELGLVEHQPYKGVELTPRGRRVALEVLRHHRLLEAYLASSLGVPWDRVHDEAEVLEHVLSEELEALIAAKLGHPTHDPHGDPIPSADLVIAEERTECLSTLEPGE